MISLVSWGVWKDANLDDLCLVLQGSIGETMQMHGHHGLNNLTFL